jgi:hypothetical protein
MNVICFAVNERESVFEERQKTILYWHYLVPTWSELSSSDGFFMMYYIWNLKVHCLYVKKHQQLLISIGDRFMTTRALYRRTRQNPKGKQRDIKYISTSV